MSVLARLKKERKWPLVVDDVRGLECLECVRELPHPCITKSVALCTPTWFDIEYVINPWMAGNEGKVDKRLMRQQWERLRRELEAHTEVHVMEGERGFPDQAFIANAGLPIMHDGRAISVMSTMSTPERKDEVLGYGAFFKSLKPQILPVPLRGAYAFEGAGDALVDERGILWGGYGFRSQAEAYDEISARFHIPIIRLRLVDAHFYHLDTCFAPIDENVAVFYSEAFSDGGAALIEAYFREAINVSRDEAETYVCNLVRIPGTKIIVMPEGASRIAALLLSKGYEVITGPVSEFQKAGGGYKCLTLYLP